MAGDLLVARESFACTYEDREMLSESATWSR
jgi:hypothetical protein